MDVKETLLKEYETPVGIYLTLITEGVFCHSNEGVEFEDWNK